MVMSPTNSTKQTMICSPCGSLTIRFSFLPQRLVINCVGSGGIFRVRLPGFGATDNRKEQHLERCQRIQHDVGRLDHFSIEFVSDDDLLEWCFGRV